MKKKVAGLLALVIIIGVIGPTGGVHGQEYMKRNSVEGRENAKLHEYFTIRVDYRDMQNNRVRSTQKYGIVEGESITVFAPEVDGYDLRFPLSGEYFIEYNPEGCREIRVDFIYTERIKTPEELAAEALKEEQKEEARVKAILDQEKIDRAERLGALHDIKGIEWYADDLNTALRMRIVRGERKVFKDETTESGLLATEVIRPNDIMTYADLFSLVSGMRGNNITKSLEIEKVREIQASVTGGKSHMIGAGIAHALGYADKMTEEEVLSDVTKLDVVRMFTKVVDMNSVDGKKSMDISGKFKDMKDIKEPLIDIVNGNGEGLFGKDEKVTRAQGISMVVRALEVLGKIDEVGQLERQQKTNNK